MSPICGSELSYGNVSGANRSADELKDKKCNDGTVDAGEEILSFSMLL